MSVPILQIDKLRFTWPNQPSPCLQIESMRIMPGETLFLYGPSGCGKSTLLSLMAGVFLPQQGSIQLQGTDWASLSASQRDRQRANHVGYIFQQFNLLPYLSVLENVLLPCRFSSLRSHAAIQRSGSLQADAQRWFQAMDLDPTLWHKPAQALSVGQQQRVAAARALIGSPALIVADEPTSALDEERRDSFMNALLQACNAAGSALVFVSHDQRIANRLSRQLALPQVNQASPSQEALAS